MPPLVSRDCLPRSIGMGHDAGVRIHARPSRRGRWTIRRFQRRNGRGSIHCRGVHLVGICVLMAVRPRIGGFRFSRR